MTTENRPTPIVEQLLSKREVAELLGVTERTIDNYRSSGRLRAIKLSAGVVRFDPYDLRAFIEQVKAEGVD
ncbi:MAG: helix-turn-helix domain-containing protein [Phycisphaeraceae bacterium]